MDIIDANIDGRGDPGHNDGGRSEGDRDDGGPNNKKRARGKDHMPPPQKKRPGRTKKAIAVANAQKDPVLSPPRDTGSPETVSLALYCQEHDRFRQKWDGAQLAAEPASHLWEELDGRRKQCIELQDNLVEAGR